MAYVRHRVTMLQSPGDSASHDKVLRAVAVRGGPLAAEAAAALTPPALPPAVAHIATWYVQLAATRRGSLSPQPITYADIQAWAAMMRIQPTPTEVDLLRACDTVTLEVMAEASTPGPTGTAKAAA